MYNIYTLQKIKTIGLRTPGNSSEALQIQYLTQI